MSATDALSETTAEDTTTHQTAETRFVDAGGVRFAFRRFGPRGALPLVMLQHFRGNLDNWDPALTDALSAEREVILVDYPGVGSSTGEPSHSIADDGAADDRVHRRAEPLRDRPGRVLDRWLRRAGDHADRGRQWSGV